MRKRPHPFTRLDRFRLWWSYQRYGLLMATCAIALSAVVLWALPLKWCLWIPAVAISITLLRAAAEILGRYPRKLRLTAVAVRRIERGRFRPTFVRAHCGDPCFRVVANEILTRAKIDRTERKALIAQFARELDEASRFVVLVDHTNGTVVRADGRGHIETIASP